MTEPTHLPSKPAPSVGIDSLDAEHGVHLGLIGAMERVLIEQREWKVAEKILNQLITYTNGHFMSEQLLMRLHAHPQYDAHLREHDRLFECFDRLSTHLKAGDRRQMLEGIRTLEEDLLQHIETWDRALGAS